MKIIDLEQGAASWHEWRTTGIGASDAPIILGLSRYTTRVALMTKKLDQLRHHKGVAKVKRPVDNGAIARGQRLEPVARQLYTDLTGIPVKALCVVSDRFEWLKASLDGYSAKPPLVLEIKCVNATDHALALSGEVPPMYMAQCQHQLAIAETPVCHYWSYTDNNRFSPREQAALVEILPDFEYQEKIVASELTFWNELQERLLSTRHGTP